MTEQPDLKARVEELRRDLRVLADYSIPLPDPGRVKRTAKGAEEQIAALLSRITDLEAERDEWREKFNGAAEACAQFGSETQAAESRLALAEKVVEAGKDLQAATNTSRAWSVLEAQAWEALQVALTAYEENTSSKDLTTGEDDA